MSSALKKIYQTAAAAAISAPLLMPLGAYAQDANDLPLVPANDATISTVVDNNAAPVAGENEELFEQSFFEEIGSPIDFDNPWILGVLPPTLLLFMLIMRSVPPRPKEEDFPFIRLLFDLDSDEQEADKMPWWQRAVNYGAVSAIAIAAAGPHLNQAPSFEGEGPVLIAVDNGFASAPDWQMRVEEMTNIIRHAHNQDREIIILPTARPETGGNVGHSGSMQAAAALDYLHAMEPQSWSINHGQSTVALEAIEMDLSAAYWLSNGLEGPNTTSFAVELGNRAPLTVIENSEQHPVLLMMEPQFENGDYRITVKRSEIEEAQTLSISAYNESHVLITRQDLVFEEGASEASIVFESDSASANGIRLNDVFRFAIDREQGAGTTALVDEKWKPRSVGLVVQNQFDVQSLLGEARFINAALGPHVDLYQGGIEALIDSGDVSVLVIPDAVTINDISRAKLEAWVESGGTLLRFAGPNMARAEHKNDPLLPVDLRRGTRSLNEGVAAARDIGHIENFAENSPFVGVEIDENINIERQILAQPGPDTDSKIWASLADGTPLVSADSLGQGKVVLVHTSANTRWGDLSLSPMFIDLMLGVVQQSNSVQDTSDYQLPMMPPISVLDGFGDLEAPITTVEPISQSVVDVQDMGPLHPPGFYGNTVTRYAYNISDTITDLQGLGDLPETTARQTYAQSVDKKDLTHPLWAGGLGLLFISSMILFAQQGHFDRKGSARRRHNNAMRRDNEDFTPSEPGM